LRGVEWALLRHDVEGAGYDGDPHEKKDDPHPSISSSHPHFLFTLPGDS